MRATAVGDGDIGKTHVGLRTIGRPDEETIIRRVPQRAVLNGDIRQRTDSIHEPEHRASLLDVTGVLAAVVEVRLIEERHQVG